MTTRGHLALGALVAALSSCGQSSSPAATKVKVPVADSPQRGPSDAWVTLVEFADFECPFCRAEEPVLSDVESAYGADLRLVFKYLPLSDVHPHARAAAIAAECAARQGKFWELHDLLFETALDDAALLADAGQVPGLDVAAWHACLQAAAPADRVAADVALAASIGVDGTPTFVVNGALVVGAVPEGELRAVIERARSEALASGIPRAEYYDKVVLGN